MNKIRIGKTENVFFPRGSFLYLGTSKPNLDRAARKFNPLEDHFNPLPHLDDIGARIFAEAIYTTTPGGESTLTMRNGLMDIAECIVNDKPRHFDEITGTEEVDRIVANAMLSPVLREIFCGVGKQFDFRPKGVVVAHLDRAVLGDFVARVVGRSIMATYKGQLVVNNLEFFGINGHTNLISQNRLIAGVSSLDRLPDELRAEVLSIHDLYGQGATYKDACTLADEARVKRNTDGYDTFVLNAMRADRP